MTEIVIGTTPTIIYTFKIVDVSDITEAILTVKKQNKIIIRKGLESATVGKNSIAWDLTQEETLAIEAGGARMMLNWLTADGVRGASREEAVNGVNNHIREVME